MVVGSQRHTPAALNPGKTPGTHLAAGGWWGGGRRLVRATVEVRNKEQCFEEVGVFDE
jgi:hypothetical protein